MVSPPEAFYGFRRPPFRKAPDPEALVSLPAVEEALARLEYAALEREVAVLTGEIGVGKTTLTRALADRIEEQVTLAWIVHPRLTPNQLLERLALGVGLEPPRSRVRLVDALHERIFALWEEGRPVVLLIDEAQMLPFPETFEELRLLTNVQMDAENLLGLILVGQPELARRLAHPRLAPLAQRIGVRYHLGPLTPEEVARYVEHRTRAAGREAPLFTPEAVTAIAGASRGIPRIVNNVCSNAMLAGFVAERDPIDAELVLEVIRELGLEVA